MALMTKWIIEQSPALTWPLPTLVWTATKEFARFSTTTSVGQQPPRWRGITAQPTMSQTVCASRIGLGTASSAISKEVGRLPEELERWTVSEQPQGDPQSRQRTGGGGGVTT